MADKNDMSPFGFIVRIAGAAFAMIGIPVCLVDIASLPQTAVLFPWLGASIAGAFCIWFVVRLFNLRGDSR